MSQSVLDILDVIGGTLHASPALLAVIVVFEILAVAIAIVLLVRYAKFAGYMARNARRNLLRSILTIGSISISLFLMMALMSLLAMLSDAARLVRDKNRLVTLSTQGFDNPVPIALVNQVRAIDGVVAASPLSWYGGKYQEEVMPFAQFGIDPDSIFTIYDEFTVPPEQLKAFQEDRTGCCIGSKLASERKLKVGDRLPLTGTFYPFNLNLTIRAIYDGPSDSDLKTCWFHWEYLDEGLKRDFQGRDAGNAGAIVIKCKDANSMMAVARKFDELTLNSDTPTRTQTEEAFIKMFLEMYGDLRGLIARIGMAVVLSLALVAGNAMAMSLRERTTEVAVLKAIGFSRPLVVSLVLLEAVLVASIGGVLGSIGTKLLLDAVDVSRFVQGMAVFYVPWPIALFGLGTALLIGFVSGLVPAVRAANLPVLDGLRKVV
jgi:putative ABC transport system permease protein